MRIDNLKTKYYERFKDGIYGKKRERDPHYYEVPEKVEGCRAMFKDGEKVMLNSYSYLGLENHPRVKEQLRKSLCEEGVGSGGVRCLSGSRKYHDKLEENLADFNGTEAGLVFTSGFQTNYSTIQSLMSKGDLILADLYSHQSLQDGCYSSGANVRRFKHNDLDDLEEKLENREERNVLIVTDAVFSMHGDIAPVEKIISLAEEKGAIVYIDEAHSLGVLGKTGKGITEYYDLNWRGDDILMGTLSKTIPTIGGYVCSSKEMIEFFRHCSHGMLFSGALPLMNCVVADESLNIIRDETWRVEKLRENIKYFRDGIKEVRLEVGGCDDTPIIPVYVRSNRIGGEFVDECWRKGVWVNYVGYPAVAKGQELLRCCITSNHGKEDLEKIIDVFDKVGDRLEIKREEVKIK